MKTTIFVLWMIVLPKTAISQNLSFKELLKIYSEPFQSIKTDSLLILKGFEKVAEYDIKCNQNEIVFYNPKHRNEKLFISHGFLSYETNEFEKGWMNWAKECNLIENIKLISINSQQLESSQFDRKSFAFENTFSNELLYIQTGLFLDFFSKNSKANFTKLNCLFIYDKDSCYFNNRAILGSPKSQM